MKKTLTSICAALLLPLCALAQQVGGVKATVVSRAGRAPIADATITVLRSGSPVSTATSSQNGTFEITGLEDGKYILTVEAEGYASSQINLSVEGFVRDLMFVSLVPEQAIKEADDSSYAEFDMEDSGYSDNPSILSEPTTHITI